LLLETGEHRNEDRRSEKLLEANRRHARCDRAFEDGSGQKRKNGLGGRRKSLIRLDSAKEIQGFYLDFVAENLEFLVLGFDFLALGLEIRPRA
jgi:hypothetical protein